MCIKLVKIYITLIMSNVQNHYQLYLVHNYIILYAPQVIDIEWQRLTINKVIVFIHDCSGSP